MKTEFRTSFLKDIKRLGKDEMWRFEMVDTLTEQEENLAKEILDLVILKHRFQELAGTGLS